MPRGQRALDPTLSRLEPHEGALGKSIAIGAGLLIALFSMIAAAVSSADDNAAPRERPSVDYTPR